MKDTDFLDAKLGARMTGQFLRFSKSANEVTALPICEFIKPMVLENLKSGRQGRGRLTEHFKDREFIGSFRITGPWLRGEPDVDQNKGVEYADHLKRPEPEFDNGECP